MKAWFWSKDQMMQVVLTLTLVLALLALFFAATGDVWGAKVFTLAVGVLALVTVLRVGVRCRTGRLGTPSRTRIRPTLPAFALRDDVATTPRDSCARCRGCRAVCEGVVEDGDCADVRHFIEAGSADLDEGSIGRRASDATVE